MIKKSNDMNANELKKCIGNNIKLFRKKAGLSQDKLAELVNMEMKSLSRIESGHNYPQCENLVAISKALDITSSKTMTYTEFNKNNDFEKFLNIDSKALGLILFRCCINADAVGVSADA